MSELEKLLLPALIWVLVTLMVIQNYLWWSITEPEYREFMRRVLTLAIFVLSSAWMYNVSTYQPFFLGAVGLGSLLLLALVVIYTLRHVRRH